MAYGRGQVRTRQTNMRISDTRIEWLKVEMEKMLAAMRQDAAQPAKASK